MTIPSVVLLVVGIVVFRKFYILDDNNYAFII